MAAVSVGNWGTSGGGEEEGPESFDRKEYTDADAEDSDCERCRAAAAAASSSSSSSRSPPPASLSVQCTYPSVPRESTCLCLSSSPGVVGLVSEKCASATDDDGSSGDAATDTALRGTLSIGVRGEEDAVDTPSVDGEDEDEACESAGTGDPSNDADAGELGTKFAAAARLAVVVLEFVVVGGVRSAARRD